MGSFGISKIDVTPENSKVHKKSRSQRSDCDSDSEQLSKSEIQEEARECKDTQRQTAEELLVQVAKKSKEIHICEQLKGKFSKEIEAQLTPELQEILTSYVFNADHTQKMLSDCKNMLNQEKEKHARLMQKIDILNIQINSKDEQIESYIEKIAEIRLGQAMEMNRQNIKFKSSANRNGTVAQSQIQISKISKITYSTSETAHQNYQSQKKDKKREKGEFGQFNFLNKFIERI